MTFLEALVDKKIITAEDSAALEAEAREGGQTLEAILEKRGVTPEQILSAKSTALEIPIRTIQGKEIARGVLDYIPEESALHYKFVPLAVTDNVLEVGLVDPDDIEARDALNFISAKVNLPYKIFLISEADFDKVVAIYKGLSAEVTQALSELETELSPSEKGRAREKRQEAGEARTETKIVEDAPVTKIVATILRYATEGSASDIHIEPMRENIRVRFRVDGVLNTSLILPTKLSASLVARIKILSNMRLDEKRKPQDGRFSAKIEGRKIDFRVSTFPVYYGEKIVMRILDQERGVRGLEDMGLTAHYLEVVNRAIRRPYGIILISGPTGSGKSTTLYSMLNLIDKEKNNVLSLEDPIEYSIDGVNQSQVRPEIGYTFANGLRTTLRQDPNIIMVGEIRDKETAQLAVQAALTGHLVLSTIHTNNAIGVIPRLIDMGVDPYLIAPTLVLVMAQRLAATLCPGGGKDVPLEGSLRVMLDKQFSDLPAEFRHQINIPATIKEIQPTPDCPNGTRGRIAVFEMFEMDREIEQVLLTVPTELELTKVLRHKGMLTLKEDALLKAFSGIIPFEEVNKL
jgi:type IV pilus assembly protein PilB